MELLDKDSKTAVCKMLKESREVWAKPGKGCMNKWKCQQIENIKKEPKGNSGAENYNNQTEKFTGMNDMMN